MTNRMKHTEHYLILWQCVIVSVETNYDDLLKKLGMRVYLTVGYSKHFINFPKPLTSHILSEK